MATGVMAQDTRRPEIEARQSPLFNAEVVHTHSWHELGEVYICLLLLVTSGEFPVPFCNMQRHQGNHLKQVWKGTLAVPLVLLNNLFLRRRHF